MVLIQRVVVRYKFQKHRDLSAFDAQHVDCFIYSSPISKLMSG